MTELIGRTLGNYRINRLQEDGGIGIIRAMACPCDDFDAIGDTDSDNDIGTTPNNTGMRVTLKPLLFEKREVNNCVTQ